MKTEEVRGIIFNIQRFSLHDGPGIRTNLFLKGCLLDCPWCHNPESKAAEPEIAYYPAKCVLCGACGEACPQRLHRFGEAGHAYSRGTCSGCGACAEACVTGALDLIGRSFTAGEAFAEAKKDEAFYRNSGGGMTISGGEPFYQSGFTLALLRLAKEGGLHSCVETSGAAPFETLREAAGLTDLFLYDLKETDAEKHRAFTGISNELILENLQKLDDSGARTVLRCPIIPGCNDREDHFRGIGAVANRLRNVTGIDIEPYHPLGISKAAGIGKAVRHQDTAIPPGESVKAWAGAVQAYTSVPVRVS
ncbi:MAG: glycyl-radical enzyme activating protein [Treponema sp.]|jgi:pyruvate formate lyase activating enzyme|nr:glycyl-radical enzyme activating protein [Treponema sp.]